MTPTAPPAQQPGRPVRRAGDRVFAAATRGAGLLILLILAGVTVFLIVHSMPAVTAPASQLPGGKGVAHFLWPLLFGTLISSVIALIVATPLGLGIALFVTNYAPRRLAQALGYLVDLLAAIPSIVYGFWGIAWLAPRLVPFYEWLHAHLSWIPLFAGPPSATGRTMMT
ncbi:MAG: phosphate ABC transporter permease subunit PstC, partial [Kineosporiaceae bacterium]